MAKTSTKIQNSDILQPPENKLSEDMQRYPEQKQPWSNFV